MKYREASTHLCCVPIEQISSLYQENKLDYSKPLHFSFSVILLQIYNIQSLCFDTRVNNPWQLIYCEEHVRKQWRRRPQIGTLDSGTHTKSKLLSHWFCEVYNSNCFTLLCSVLLSQNTIPTAICSLHLTHVPTSRNIKLSEVQKLRRQGYEINTTPCQNKEQLSDLDDGCQANELCISLDKRDKRINFQNFPQCFGYSVFGVRGHYFKYTMPTLTQKWLHIRQGNLSSE